MSVKYHNFEVLFILLICLYPQSTDVFTYHFGISLISSLRTFWLFLDLNLTTFISFLILSNRKDPKILFILRFDVKLFDYNLGKMFCQFTVLQYKIDLPQVLISIVADVVYKLLHQFSINLRSRNFFVQSSLQKGLFANSVQKLRKNRCQSFLFLSNEYELRSCRYMFENMTNDPITLSHTNFTCKDIENIKQFVESI